VPRRIEIVFAKRNVRGVATLLEEAAPRTAGLIWEALPLEGPAYHARWAGREVYTLVPPLAAEPGSENATINPIPGDLLYLRVEPDSVDLPPAMRTGAFKVDIALFYGRHNYLRGPAGDMPGNLFATITENLEGLATACTSIWYEGAVGERMILRRLDD
jgi:hypothetical protein